MIDECDFTYLLTIPNICMSHKPLVALAKRFHREHNTFHLPTSKMTVTLEVIYKILGLCIGEKIYYDLELKDDIVALREVFNDETLMIGHIA